LRDYDQDCFAHLDRADTVAVLAEDYLKKHARKHKRSAAEDERILNADVLPVPEETIRRRHASGVRNFFALYETPGINLARVRQLRPTRLY
jgi:hypothetical protein